MFSCLPKHRHAYDTFGASQPPPATGTIPVNPGLMGQIGQPAMMMGMMQQPGGMPGMPNMQLQMMLQQRAAMGNAPNMPAQETLDDGEFGGVHVSAQSRHMLMQKLARNTDLQGLGLQFAPTMPAPGPPGLGMPGMPKGIPGVPMGQANPSTYLLLVNMFDPAKEEDPNFHLDIQEDVKEECQAKFGQVIQVRLVLSMPCLLSILEICRALICGSFGSALRTRRTPTALSFFNLIRLKVQRRCAYRERKRDSPKYLLEC